MIVTLVRLIYNDVTCIGLEFEVAYTVKFYVSHHIGEHTISPTG